MDTQLNGHAELTTPWPRELSEFSTHPAGQMELEITPSTLPLWGKAAITESCCVYSVPGPFR